jgi:hypothetical protein
MCWCKAGPSLPARDCSCHPLNGPLKITSQEMSGQPFPTPSFPIVDTTLGMDPHILRFELVFMVSIRRV